MFGLSVRNFGWLVLQEEKCLRQAFLNLRDSAIAVRENVPGIQLKNKTLQLIEEHWREITAALDLLADTSAAMQEATRSYPQSGFGKQYLYIYGALQSLSLQQDAARSLFTCLGESFHLNDELKYIRQFRIDILHGNEIHSPANKKLKENSMLSRPSLCNPEELRVWISHSREIDRNSTRNEVIPLNLFEIINKQDTLLSNDLKNSRLIYLLDNATFDIRNYWLRKQA
ncbi:MAG: hypothetical protein MRY59_00630 [Aquisalinus sp.]|nr:hypothetical protein [Aquisalinus sp.]